MAENLITAPGSHRRRVGPGDLAHLDFIEEVFLPAAVDQGYVTPADSPLLHRLVGELVAEATPAGGPPIGVPVSGSSPVGAPPALVPPPLAPAPLLPPPGVPPLPRSFESLSAPTLPMPAAAVSRPPAAPREPSALARWWARTRDAVGSDLAVHGLAYLGVLLFFVGAFGLVVFAFGDVAPSLRPLAEAVIAAAPFAAAALLRRRGAEVVGRALKVAGGLVLPIMLITTFLDGVAFPPDLSGVPLVVALTAATAAVGVGYAVWAGRHPDSALALLVAPVAWLATGMATIGLARAIPEGKAVATPGAAQVGAMMAALVVTVAWARLQPGGRLAAPTRVAAVPGLAVLGALGLLSWVAEGGPAVPILAAGLLGVLALELLADRLPDDLVGVLQPGWWAVATLASSSGAVEAGLEPAVVVVAAAAGFVAILEGAHAARRPALALALPAMGAALTLLAITGDAGPATVTFAAASIWAAVRRRNPFPVKGAPGLLDAAAAVLPLGAVLSFAVAADPPTAVLATSMVAALATVPARGRALARSSTDRYWTWWWVGACLLAILGVVVAWSLDPGPDVPQRWLLVTALAILTVAAHFGPLPRRWRAPSVTALAGATWVSTATVLGLSAMVVVALLALAGLAQVAIAHSSTARALALHRASVGLTGHALGGVAVLVAMPGSAGLLDPPGAPFDSPQLTDVAVGWPLVAAVALAASGWGLTGWLDARGRSPVGAALRRLNRVLGWAPLSLAAAGLPLTVALALRRADVLPLGDPWAMAVPATAAVLYAGLGRAVHAPARVLGVAAWGGYALALLAVVAAAEPLPAAVGLLALMATPCLTPPPRRARVMVWSAWAAVVPAAWLAAIELSTWFSSLAVEASSTLALVSGGSVLLVGGALADLRRAPWAPRLRPQHSWALPPVAVGGLEVGAGAAVAILAVPGSSAVSDFLAWVTVGAAAAILATGVIGRAGALAGVAALLAWTATLRLAEPEIAARPWIAVLASAALLLAAQALSRTAEHRPPWARWDLPMLGAAAPVAATALALAGDAAAPAIFATVGAECLAVAIRLHRVTALSAAVGVLGTALVLVGAGRAGSGWLALALLGLATGLTALATRLEGGNRRAAQVGGALAAVASWRVASDWLGLGDQEAVDVAAVVSGVLAVLAAAAVLRTSIHRSWVRVWGGLAGAGAAVSAWDAVTTMELLRGEVQPSWWIAAGLVVVGVALMLAARPLALDWLREVGVAYGVASVLVCLIAAGVEHDGQALAFTLLTAVVAAVTLAVHRTRAAGMWVRPLLGVGAASTVLALGAASLGALPLAWVPALAAAALEAAAAGAVLRRVQLQLASPVLAALAWIAFAVEALDGNPQWVTLPLGLATLVVVGLWRQDRLSRGQRVATTEIIVLERLGVLLLVGSSFVQAVTETLAYALLAAAIGVGVAAWGVITRVRRRVAAGALVVLASFVLLLGVPLVNLLPSWEGAGLWVLIAALGLGAVVVASLIERGRTAVRKGLARITDVTAGWE